MAILIQPSNATPDVAATEANAKNAAARREARSGEAPTAAADANEAPVLAAAIDVGGTKVISGGRTIEFSFNSDADRVVVTVRSNDTEEIVRQIPPDDYLKFVARFKEMMGVLFDETA